VDEHNESGGMGHAAPSAFDQACADLARKAADQSAGAQFVQAGQIELQMKDMGCKPPRENSN